MATHDYFAPADIPGTRMQVVVGEPTVLITGALAGIGQACARAFARQRSRIVISGRQEKQGQSFAAELRVLGADADFFAADVRKENEIDKLVNHVIQRFGRLDVAVNSAGIEGRAGPLVDRSVDDYAAAFDTNVLGVFLSMKYELRVMLRQRQGSIINLSSVLGQVGSPGVALYAATKFAVEGLTRCAALEAAGNNVRVNAVAPGPVETGMLRRFTGSEEAKAQLVAGVPMRRAAQADEIAETILFLASDKARYITGQSVGVDGGVRAA